MALRDTDSFSQPELSLLQKLLAVNWLMVLMVCIIATVGFAMLYSAAGGSYQPWAIRQMTRFAVGLGVLICVAMVDPRIWLRWAYAGYGVAFLLLVVVEIMGDIGMGAQRWLDLGIFQLQPSELMKVMLVLALARYFNGLTHEDIGRVIWVVPPVLMILLPGVLVLKQPDLGTASMLMMAGAAVMFLAGVRIWKFLLGFVVVAAALPVFWSMLRDYQKNRVLIFLNPEADPLGAGYHITQSKIALGSGGLFGKGYLQGSQAHLNFLPEKQTDFIFTMLAEEFGLVGGLCLIALYIILLGFGFYIALRARSQFSRLVALGMTVNLFLYAFINIAMVTGLIPVVGIPLPLVSYGGTAMLTVLVAIGLILGVSVHREVRIGRRGADPDP
ncbi:MAG: rod shape-determining protein RodA [Thalassobaculales bacterium]